VATDASELVDGLTPPMRHPVFDERMPGQHGRIGHDHVAADLRNRAVRGRSPSGSNPPDAGQPVARRSPDGGRRNSRTTVRHRFSHVVGSLAYFKSWGACPTTAPWWIVQALADACARGDEGVGGDAVPSPMTAPSSTTVKGRC